MRRTLRCDGKLLSPEPRRKAVEVLRARFRVTERLACRCVGQHRSTHRHGGKAIVLEEVKLRHRLREIAAEHIRWGCRMAYRLLRREGWTVNHKRVQRLWREEGLQRPTPRQRQRARPADGSACGVTGPNIPTRCGPWISRSTR